MVTLSQLKQYLRTKGKVSMKELILTTQEDVQTLKIKLQHFINKGQLQESKLTPQCGIKCGQCVAELTYVYAWRSEYDKILINSESSECCRYG